MGKRSGITKGGRVMNPADRERKQQRAKELKRNRKQRTAVRQAIVKNRDPEEIIEQMSRLDDQEFDSQRQLSLNVIQEKRHKLRGTFIQIINLCRQEKEEKKAKDLERMMYEYEVERRKKEENFRAMTFSETSNFDEIPLPFGLSAPDAASTPSFSVNIDGGAIGPQMPAQLQAAMRAGILKKSTTVSAKKKHKFPPGPPPGLPLLLPLFDDDDDGDNEQSEQTENLKVDGDYRRRQRKRVRFGEQQVRDDKHGENEMDAEEEEEDYAPVEIPESMFSNDQRQQQQGGQPTPPFPSQQPIPSLSAPQVGIGPPPSQQQPGFAPPNQHHPHYPPYPLQPPGYIMRAPGAPPSYPPGPEQFFAAAGRIPPLKGGVAYPVPSDPHSSAIITAEPQVMKPHVTIVPPGGSNLLASKAKSQFSAAPQMRDIKREATRFVPTAVKIQRPVVAATSIGPRLPTGGSVAAGQTTRLVPQTATAIRAGKTKTIRGTTKGVAAAAAVSAKSVDEACDDFLNELQGLL